MLATLAIVSVTAFIFYKLFLSKKTKWPPGPRGIPFVGNLLQIDSTGPHHTLKKWAKEFGDVYKISVFGKNIVVLSGAEEVHDALVKYSNEFADRPYSLRMR